MQREIACKVEQVVQKARAEQGVKLDGFKAVFTNRGKRKIVSYRRENGALVAVFNAKWLTDANRSGLLNNTVYHIVAQAVASEKKVAGPLSNLALQMGAPHMSAIEGLTTPQTCRRTPKTRSWAYIDSNGRQRLTTTRKHNRMQKEHITYRFSDTGATIDRMGFVGKV